MLLPKLTSILFNSVPVLVTVKKVAQVTGSAGERGILGNDQKKGFFSGKSFLTKGSIFVES